MSKALSAFYDALLPELPGCTVALVDYSLKQVAREFCEQSSAWRVAFDPITADASTRTYDLITPEANTDLVRLLRLSVGGTLVWAANEIVQFPAETPRHPPHRPPFTVDLDAEQFTLTEQPDGDISIIGSLMPKLAATTLPDLLFTRHLEAMRAGVLSRIMKMGNKPWTDRALAVEYESAFNAYVHRAATAAAGGNTVAPLRTRAMAV